MLTIQQIRDTIADYFKDRPVKRVYLFGSYARGEATENSDVDLLVEYDEREKSLSLFDVLGFKIGLEEILRHDVELVENIVRFEGFRKFVNKDKFQIYPEC